MKRILTYLFLPAMILGMLACPAAAEGTGEIIIPEKYADKLIVETGGDDMLISVSEKESVEAAVAEGWSNPDGAGWLFAIGTVSEEELHKMLCRDMSGMEVFAEDADGRYYMYYHPTDVRIVRKGNDFSKESVAQWTELNEWAGSLKKTFVEENDGLTAVTYDNTDPSIELARAAYMEDIIYELRTLKYDRPLEPLGVDAAPYVERLIRNAHYSYADAEETPDGEYIVLYFPEEDIRIDFFLADGNYVRRTSSKGTYTSLLRAELADGEISASGVMQEWADKLAEANGLS